MATGQHLGEFEPVVWLAAGPLGEDAYGMTIRRLLLERIGRDVSIGAIFAMVDRLVRKGYLDTRRGESTATRGGKVKRIAGTGVRSRAPWRSFPIFSGGSIL
jgi:PadR family transcriptional regulator PadR